MVCKQLQHVSIASRQFTNPFDGRNLLILEVRKLRAHQLAIEFDSFDGLLLMEAIAENIFTKGFTFNEQIHEDVVRQVDFHVAIISGSKI